MKDPDAGVFYVRIVTARGRGVFEWRESADIRFTSRSSASDECDRLQAEFDKDGDPKRAYVLDQTRVPIRAGLERRVAPMRAIRLGEAA